MITIISGTNRKNSNALKFARAIERMYLHKGQPAQVLALESVPPGFFFAEMYENPDVLPAFLQEIQDRYLRSVEKFHFVVPEYNGGMPGALKLFIDAVSVRDLKGTFHGKKAALTGVSTGRAGNLRGMDQLSGVLNYLQVTVMPLQQPVSNVHKLLDDVGEPADAPTLEALEKQVDRFIAF
jgi:chromate reductase